MEVQAPATMLKTFAELLRRRRGAQSEPGHSIFPFARPDHRRSLIFRFQSVTCSTYLLLISFRQSVRSSLRFLFIFPTSSCTLPSRRYGITGAGFDHIITIAFEFRQRVFSHACRSPCLSSACIHFDFMSYQRPTGSEWVPCHPRIPSSHPHVFTHVDVHSLAPKKAVSSRARSWNSRTPCSEGKNKENQPTDPRNVSRSYSQLSDFILSDIAIPFSYLIVAASLLIDGEFETLCQLSIYRPLT